MLTLTAFTAKTKGERKMSKLKKIINKYGQPEKQSGSQYYWQCPYCRENGRDNHRDNLQYNSTKDVLSCFADKSHTLKILQDLRVSKTSINYATPLQQDYKHLFTPKKQKQYKTYLKNCNQDLLNIFHKSLKDLENIRGIEPKTVKHLKIGIDKNKLTWVFPTFEYTSGNDRNIIGFEYRPLDFGKQGIRREKGTPTGLAMINSCKPETEAIVVVEGYLDGYALWQHLNKKEQDKYYHIVTPSNGITALVNSMSCIDYSNYKKFYLFIDNDEAGNNAASEILKKYPMFERIILKCDCKDFNEHYLKCIKGKG